MINDLSEENSWYGILRDENCDFFHDIALFNLFFFSEGIFITDYFNPFSKAPISIAFRDIEHTNSFWYSSEGDISMKRKKSIS